MSEADPPMPARGLVHHDPRVREGVALAGGSGAQQELSHGRGPIPTVATSFGM